MVAVSVGVVEASWAVGVAVGVVVRWKMMAAAGLAVVAAVGWVAVVAVRWTVVPLALCLSPVMVMEMPPLLEPLLATRSSCGKLWERCECAAPPLARESRSPPCLNGLCWPRRSCPHQRVPI